MSGIWRGGQRDGVCFRLEIEGIRVSGLFDHTRCGVSIIGVGHRDWLRVVVRHILQLSCDDLQVVLGVVRMIILSLRPLFDTDVVGCPHDWSPGSQTCSMPGVILVTIKVSVMAQTHVVADFVRDRVSNDVCLFYCRRRVVNESRTGFAGVIHGAKHVDIRDAAGIRGRSFDTIRIC